MTWWKPSSGGGSSTPEGQSYNTETQKTTFAGEVAAPSVSATGEVSAASVSATGSVTGDNTLARAGSALVADRPLSLVLLSDNPSINTMPVRSMAEGIEGGLIYCHPTGQKIFDGNKLCVANIAEGAAFTSTSETAFVTQQTAASGNNRDGYWNRVSKHRIPPVLRAGILARKCDWLHSHMELGGNFGATPSGKTLTLREYWVSPTDVAVKMFEVVIDGANLAGWTSGSNRPIHIYNDYNYNDTVAGSLAAAKIRVHWRVFVGKIGTNTALWDAGESFFSSDYPIVDLTVEQRIRWTAQWNVPGGTLYTDQFEYTL